LIKSAQYIENMGACNSKKRSSERNNVYGYGMINVQRAVREV